MNIFKNILQNKHVIDNTNLQETTYSKSIPKSWLQEDNLNKPLTLKSFEIPQDKLNKTIERIAARHQFFNPCFLNKHF